MPLSSKKKKSLEEARAVLVQKQFSQLKTLIKQNENNPTNLGNLLSNSLENYKPDALELAYNYMKLKKYPIDTTRAMGKLWQTRHIGGVKIDRVVKEFGAKQAGATLGARVKKLAKNNEALGLKHDKTILRKKGGLHEGFEGEEVCEYLGSNLAIAMMGSKLSPKFRLHKRSQDKIMVASTFIEGFKTINDGADTRNAKGFGNFLARQFLVANYDIHCENAGITTINGEKYWTGIDDGRAMSYNVDRDWSRGRKYLKLPQNLDSFIQRMKQVPTHRGKQIYPSAIFYGKEFACELNDAVNNIDLELMRHIIKESMKNIKIAYGENFLSNYNIATQLKLRMGLTDPLSEQKIENTIIANIESRQKQLKSMALQEGKIVLQEAMKKGDKVTINYMAQNMPEAVVLEIKPYVLFKNKNGLNKFPLEALSVFIKDCVGKKDRSSIEYLRANRPEALSMFVKHCMEKEDKSSMEYLRDEFPGELLNFMFESIKKNDLEALSMFVKYCIEKKDNASIEYLKNNYPEAISNVMFQSIEKNDQESVEFLKSYIPDLKDNKSSLLKYVISNGKINAAVNLIKKGVILKADEIDKDKVLTIQNANYFWSKKGTENDKLRVAIIAAAPDDKKEAMKPQLALKRSPLFLAIETGQSKLATELVQAGYELKKSELQIYAKTNRGAFNKLSILGKYLGRYNEQDKKEIATSVINQIKVNTGCGR